MAPQVAGNVPVPTPGEPVTPPAFAIAATKDTPELRRLLAGIRDQLGADTLTLLLLDHQRTVLEPAATIGLDPTLRGARPVPLGFGFAGRVAQSRQVVLLAEVTADQVINPVLVAHGLRTLLGAPVMDGSELVGVVHVGYLDPRQVCDEDRRTLAGLATTLGDLLRQGSQSSDNTAALVLQRSLLPAAPVSPPGIELAARYVPADGDLGGDWYDAFELPGQRLCLVMGDVVGHGLQAAIVMGRLRSALRAYALDHDTPDEVLTRLDRKICHFEPDVQATVLVGMAEAPYDVWQFSAAGHFAPFLATPDGPGEAVPVPHDALLGVMPDVRRRATVVSVPEGGRLCLFTDGLVERRPTSDQSAEELLDQGFARLSAALAAPGDAEMSCIRVLTGVVGDAVAEDDIAVLIAQRQQAPDAGGDLPEVV
ncbi:GAF domain-containing SpoIIE family protein phosphatase [Nocardioides sp.]|uniref:PP2C family protein-serine/threonine phosphatase n=1 Tax=Nocardioides sp. TaxID=35761 RepID=UPI00260ABC94|nr:GAF domain-containing SpoIIE family protein phosphatase [Nocardioides sp.]